MRSLCIAVLILIAFAPSAHANSLRLAVSEDNSMCVAQPSVPPSVNSVYVVHDFMTGAKGSRWKIANTGSLFFIGGVSDQLVIQVIGEDPFVGITVLYDGCLTGSEAVYRMDFLWFGQPITTCYDLLVLAAEGETSPLWIDCSDNVNPAGGGFFSFNPFLWCEDCASPVDATSWGRVKALYR